MRINNYALIALIALSAAVTANCYMFGKLDMQKAVAAHDAKAAEDKRRAELRYDILASEADFVSVLDADKKFQQQVKR